MKRFHENLRMAAATIFFTFSAVLVFAHMYVDDSENPVWGSVYREAANDTVVEILEDDMASRRAIGQLMNFAVRHEIMLIVLLLNQLCLVILVLVGRRTHVGQVAPKEGN